MSSTRGRLTFRHWTVGHSNKAHSIVDMNVAVDLLSHSSAAGMSGSLGPWQVGVGDITVLVYHDWSDFSNVLVKATQIWRLRHNYLMYIYDEAFCTFCTKRGNYTRRLRPASTMHPITAAPMSGGTAKTATIEPWWVRM